MSKERTSNEYFEERSATCPLCLKAGQVNYSKPEKVLVKKHERYSDGSTKSVVINPEYKEAFGNLNLTDYRFHNCKKCGFTIPYSEWREYDYPGDRTRSGNWEPKSIGNEFSKREFSQLEGIQFHGDLDRLLLFFNETEGTQIKPERSYVFPQRRYEQTINKIHLAIISEASKQKPNPIKLASLYHNLADYVSERFKQEEKILTEREVTINEIKEYSSAILHSLENTSERATQNPIYIINSRNLYYLLGSLKNSPRDQYPVFEVHNIIREMLQNENIPLERKKMTLEKVLLNPNSLIPPILPSMKDKLKKISDKISKIPERRVREINLLDFEGKRIILPSPKMEIIPNLESALKFYETGVGFDEVKERNNEKIKNYFGYVRALYELSKVTGTISKKEEFLKKARALQSRVKNMRATSLITSIEKELEQMILKN